MEFIPGYREANAPKRPRRRREVEPVSTGTPMLKVNGLRTATIADLEHAEAVMGAGPVSRAGRRHVDSTESRAAERPRRARPAVRPLPERRPLLRQLRCAHGPLRHLLPLLQLRQQHGLFVIVKQLVRSRMDGVSREGGPRRDTSRRGPPGMTCRSVSLTMQRVVRPTPRAVAALQRPGGPVVAV